jgi:hypothetical protein
VPEPEPIELPWPVFEAMSKSKTFFDLLEGWDQFGPAHTKSLRAQDALALIGKILPHIPKPRLGYGQHFQNLCYDLGEGCWRSAYLITAAPARLSATNSRPRPGYGCRHGPARREPM